MRRYPKSIILFLFAILLALTLPDHASSQQKKAPKPEKTQITPVSDTGLRTALVIGNSRYDFSPLVNPVNDATDMASVLEGLGFNVIIKKDADLQTMEDALEEFGSRLKKGGVGLFFYAGHGVQVAGNNYLIPIGAKINKESDVRFKAVDVNRILAEMENAGNGLNIVILDACRDNPFKNRFRSVSRGLAIVSDAPAGTFIAYSTGPGKVAADGEGRNSPYTKALLEYIKEPGITIEDVFKNVRQRLMQETKGRQTPWELSSLQGRFYFATDLAPTGQTTKMDDPLDDERRRLDAERARIEVEKRQIAEQKRLMDEKARLEKERQAMEEEKKKLEAQQLAMATKPPEMTSRSFTDPATGMEFVFVRGGCYDMGDTFGDGHPLEKPVHNVCVDDFYIGKYEVTQGQWRAIMGNNPSRFKDCGDNCPVENVSYDGIQTFIDRLNTKSGKRYRLPTEAEWEYAARSGGKREKYAGTSSDADLDSYAWHKSNSGNKTHPVGTKKPNGLGIYDMSGNVWEWVSDWYSDDYYRDSPRNNPQGPSSGSFRVRRGGGWYNSLGVLRASARYLPSGRRGVIGFRLAAQPEGIK